MNPSDDLLHSREGLFTRPPQTAADGRHAARAAVADHARYLGHTLTTDEVTALLRCPTHPQAGISSEVCVCLHRKGITDPCAPQELTGPDGALTVQVLACDPACDGWDGEVLYPQWDVALADGETAVLVFSDGSTADIDPGWIDQAWLTLPGIGLPAASER